MEQPKGVTPRGRDRILSQARALFLEHGYAEVSMQQIADASDMTKAALYYHFRDKEDLFAHVILQEMQQQRHNIEQEIDREIGLERQLQRLVRLYFDQVTPNVLRMMDDFRKHVPESRHDDVHRELERFVDAISSVFVDARAAGEMRDVEPRLAASIFFQTMVALIHTSMHAPTFAMPDPDSAARLVTSIVLHGIAAPERDSPLRPGEACRRG